MHSDPVKPNMTKTKAPPWSKSDEEAVELRSVTSVMAAKHSAAFFVGPSGERFRKKPEGLKRAVRPTARFRSYGARSRGCNPLSGCRGETSGAGRGQGPAQLSDGNRHLVLGITCRQNLLFSWVQEAGASHDFQKGGMTVAAENDKAQWKVRQERDL